jgi:hypothetical protein
MFYSTGNVKSWWTKLLEKNSELTDIIAVTYNDTNVITYLNFKRKKMAYYNEATKEYINYFSKDVNYLDAINKLNKSDSNHDGYIRTSTEDTGRT